MLQSRRTDRLWKGQKMGINEIQNMMSLASAEVQDGRKVNLSGRKASFSEVLEEKQQKCPYSHLAKDGVIEYNGVTFACDYRTNSLCLGDMSDSNNVLNISLPSGGNLLVNVDNLGDLSNAVGMFSPADLNAIMRAVAKYNFCTKKREVDLSEAIKTYEETHKLSAEELKEEKDWRDMTSEEWDKILEGFDAGEVSAEDVVDHENNWTRKLRTDDQTILMTAKEAQKMESNALLKYKEIQLLGIGITIDPREWVR